MNCEAEGTKLSHYISGRPRIVQIYYKVVLQRGCWCTACLWYN